VLEALVKSQAHKIAELEKACADLQREKENVIVQYRKLAAKPTSYLQKKQNKKKCNM
jgi:hypothetical protein